MKLIKPSYKILEQENSLEGINKHIEKVGRVCYKSEDKITDDSYKSFINRLIAAKHYAMLEHGTVYLKVTYTDKDFATLLMFYGHNRFSDMTHNCASTEYYITTNMRVLIENNHMDDLQYACLPTESHKKRITVHFVCDNGIAREFTRHRVFSFAQESTRYCNYSKNKFGKELTYILPSWVPEVSEDDWVPFNHALFQCEKDYFALLNYGWKPEQARNVLPLALKTELIMTGFIDYWQHFFNLRALGTTGTPHPQAKELAHPLYEEFIKRGYIKAVI